MLEHVPCTRYKLQKAGCLTLLGGYQETKSFANVILQIDEQTVDAIHTRGVCLYYQGNLKQPSNHFSDALRLAQNRGQLQLQLQLQMNNYERAKAFMKKTEERNNAFNESRFSEDEGQGGNQINLK
jgi:Tfp pilus assembly protein PilF